MCWRSGILPFHAFLGRDLRVNQTDLVTYFILISMRAYYSPLSFGFIVFQLLNMRTNQVIPRLILLFKYLDQLCRNGLWNYNCEVYCNAYLDLIKCSFSDTLLIWNFFQIIKQCNILPTTKYFENLHLYLLYSERLKNKQG